MGMHAFIGQYAGGLSVWNRDIDRSASDGLIDHFANASGLSHDRIMHMTLRAWEHHLHPAEQDMVNGCGPWILSLGIYHRKRHGFGQQYCPACLTESPVYVRQWRLASETVCHRHLLLLIDRCSKCQQPIIPHRQFPRSTSCHNCGFLLTAKADAVVDSASQIQITQTSLRFQAGLHRDVVRVGNHELSMRVFARGVHTLVSLLHARLRDGIWGRELGTRNQLHVEIEHASVAERHRCLQLLDAVMEDWPHQFVSRAMTWGITQCTLPKPFRVDLPEWIHEGIRLLPPGRPWKPKWAPVPEPNMPRNHSKFRRDLRQIHRKRESTWRSDRADLLLKAVKGRA